MDMVVVVVGVVVVVVAAEVVTGNTCTGWIKSS